MNQLRYAVFVDLENAGGKVATLQNIIEKVKIRGDIILGKVYGYTERYSDLNPVLLSNTFFVVPSIKYGGRQKNQLDIQLVIDALETAYVNPLIDCFCIVSGDSDYTPLVGKLKSMGKFVLGISRSECASEIFINACNEFIFLESVRGPVRETRKGSHNSRTDVSGLVDDIQQILSEQADAEGWLFASELKSTLLRLRPDFSEKSFGAPTFGKLLSLIEAKTGAIRLMDQNNNLLVRLKPDEIQQPKLTRENFAGLISNVLATIREDGFERVNPSIIKAALQEAYPDFDERTLGCKKFSDLLKRLEKENIVQVEYDEDKNMLVRIL
nr:NYN domain-containing protein [bacterium]